MLKRFRTFLHFYSSLGSAQYYRDAVELSIYFPEDTRKLWVYEDQRNELTRRVVEGKRLPEMYHAFSYEPAFERFGKL